MITRRRIVVAASSAFLMPLVARGQALKEKKIIGYLANNPDPWKIKTFNAFIETLRERRWVLGENLEIRIRSSNNDDRNFEPLAEQLVRENVHVIVTTGLASSLAAKKMTSTIPIVFGSTANPVELGLVKSFARPGGNVTGMAYFSLELGPKRLELLKTIVPRAQRFARLYSASNPYMAPALAHEPDAAARKLKVELLHMPIRSSDDFRTAVHVGRARGIDAFTVEQDAVFVRPKDQELLAALAVEHRLPMMGPDSRYARSGALISYGENFEAMYQRAAVFVDKILHGMRPADIPVERPTIVDTFVNLKTAQALGIILPASIVIAAGDNVIK